MRPLGRGLRRACYVTGAAIALATCAWLAGRGSPAVAKLSEQSSQVAYRAGLGARAATAVPDVRTLVSAGQASRTNCAQATAKVGSSRVAYAALVDRDNIVVHASPHAGAAVVAKLPRLNPDGFRQVLGVVGVHTGSACKPDWYRVQLPVVPNGTFGWVRAWTVHTYRVRSRIVVKHLAPPPQCLSSRKVAARTPVAVGTASTPTPTGRFFVNERYTLPDASGPFGPNALGISAHSDVLQHVWVEDGPIGIHGTNEPWSIGRAASHGCIRVDNTVMKRVFRLAPAGTPIVVTA